MTIQKKSLTSTLNKVKKPTKAGNATASVTPATKNPTWRNLANRQIGTVSFAKKK